MRHQPTARCAGWLADQLRLFRAAIKNTTIFTCRKMHEFSHRNKHSINESKSLSKENKRIDKFRNLRANLMANLTHLTRNMPVAPHLPTRRDGRLSWPRTSGIEPVPSGLWILRVNHYTKAPDYNSSPMKWAMSQVSFLKISNGIITIWTSFFFRVSREPQARVKCIMLFWHLTGKRAVSYSLKLLVNI